MRSKLFIFFTLTSITELALLIYLGQFLGFLYTILLIIITAMIGSYLIKNTGSDIMLRVQKAIFEQQGISDTVLDGGLLILSGALLITPGFISDIVGISLHIPFVKIFVKKIIRKKFGSYFNSSNSNFNFQNFNNFNNSDNDKTIDLDDFYM